MEITSFLALCNKLPLEMPREYTQEQMELWPIISGIIDHISACALSTAHPYYTELSMLRGSGAQLEQLGYNAFKKRALRFAELFQRQTSYFNPSLMQRISHPESGFRYVVASGKRVAPSYYRRRTTDISLLEDKDYRLFVTPEEVERRSQKVLARANTVEALSLKMYSRDFVSEEITSEGSESVGMASSQGVRPSMEDSMGFASFYFVTEDSQSVPVHLQWVMDGHCGPNCARLSSHWLKECFAHNLQLHGAGILDDVTICNAMIQTAIDVDHMFTTGSEGYDGSGCTACWAVIVNGKLYTANTGDSRAIVITDATAKALSCDQKPSYSWEEEHVKRRGGFVRSDQYGVQRTNGNLAMTRSFGDHGEGGVMSPRPEITIYVLKGGESLILACDGLWDVVSTNDAADIVRNGNNKSALSIAEGLVENALAKGTQDNVSVLVCDLERLEERGFCPLQRSERKRDSTIVCPQMTDELEVEKRVDAWENLFQIMNLLNIDYSRYFEYRDWAKKQFWSYGQNWECFAPLYVEISKAYCVMYRDFLSLCQEKVCNETYVDQFIVCSDEKSWGLKKILI